MKNFFLLPCFLVCLIGFTYGADVPYKFTILDIPVEFQGLVDTIRLLDRNNRGEMVGTTVPTGPGSFFQSYFISRHKTVTQLNCPGNFTGVSALNNNGQIAGTCDTFGFILQRKTGVYTLLSFPGADATSISGINDRGHVVGQYRVGDGSDIHGFHAFIWKDGEYTTVDAPEENGLFPELHGINKQGRIVGNFFRPETFGDGVIVGERISFILDNGSFTYLDDPFGGLGFPMDINNNNQVLGLTFDLANASNSIWYLYDDGEYFRITGLPEGAGLFNGGLQPWGINDKGELAGTYVDGTGAHSFVAVPAKVKVVRR